MDNWIWGLSLIALTLAIHATGVAFMVSALHRLRLRLARRTLRFPHVFVIVITAITTLGLMLAALHATEAAMWAAAYLGLGALGSPEAAILYSVDSMATRRVGGHAATPLADAGRPRGRRWYAAVRDQHGLHLHRDAVLLSGPKTHGRLMATVGETRDHARHPNRVFQSERSSEGARRTASVRPMPLWPTLAHAIDGRPTSPADHKAEAWGR
jgi:hypothetical protein